MLLGALAVAASACAADAPQLAAPRPPFDSPHSSSAAAGSDVPSPTVAPPASTTTAPVPTTPPPTTPPPTAPPGRVVVEQDHVVFATANGVSLHFPAARVEIVGFHQSSHDGAQPITLRTGVVRSFVLEDRSRDTLPTGAADVVVDPTVEIRSPVSGRVISANTYRLYCKYSDDLVFIEPDGRPGWQVKVFHIDGFRVRPGQRVEAGVTVLAARATVLPFESQVEEHGARPVWPHVHIEVVDPSVPDRPSPGGTC